MSEINVSPIVQPGIDEASREQVQLSSEGTSKVIVHNDDVTPYDYVIAMLGDVFLLSEELADHVAWTAHTKGRAVVVVRPRWEAEKLVNVAHGRAKMDGYPLTFSLETERFGIE